MTEMNNQKDLVLSINEYAYVLDETKGHVSCLVGPTKMSLSQSDKLVQFNEKTKAFENCGYSQAKKLFTIIPENWYCVLKNPLKDNKHPAPGTSNTLPDTIMTGKKINISGPAAFALYPGQMARVVSGHTLRSNQYLLARVYEAKSANNSEGEMLDAEGKRVELQKSYVNGQILVIKGTEVSFYIPPTGIEVIPINNNPSMGYVREAVTLERLEYAILKDEDGEKRYVHGPDVVFPKPTETFVESPKGGTIFRALELSPISGIYIKVIANYKDETGKEHPIGEELFITGKEQMIYYPRPEHAMIQYDGKYMHHAIAIPKGEGRYILNRLNGEIKTIIGPQMYLPDPRFEVVVKRKLTQKECQLLYPNNKEVAAYNLGLTERAMEKKANSGGIKGIADTLNNAYSTSNQLDTLAIFEANANISRGVSYTKPRTITLDTKFDGVVSTDVWTGYAISITSKTGKREVVIGPVTKLLDYDETVEAICLPEIDEAQAFLKIENNRVIDHIAVRTKDHIQVRMGIEYNVNFIKEFKDKWFFVEDYASLLKNRMSSILNKGVRDYTIQDFYESSEQIIRDIILGNEKGMYLFEENGMAITDLIVNFVEVEKNIASVFDAHKKELVAKTLELEDAEAKMKVIEAFAEVEKQEAELKHANSIYKLNLHQAYEEQELLNEEALKEKARAGKMAEAQAKADIQVILSAIQEEENKRQQSKIDLELEQKRREGELEAEKQRVYAETVKQIMSSIGPGLIEALTAKSNAEMLETVSKNMGPYALAKGESLSATVDTLLRGTTLENLIKEFKNKN